MALHRTKKTDPFTALVVWHHDSPFSTSLFRRLPHQWVIFPSATTSSHGAHHPVAIQDVVVVVDDGQQKRDLA